MMRATIIFVFFVIIAINNKIAEATIPVATYKENSRKCVADAGANPQQVEQMRKNLVVFNEESIKMFLKCFYESMGFLEADGSIKFSMIVGELEDGYTNKEAKDIVNVCAKISRLQDEAEYVYLITECLFNGMKKSTRRLNKLAL